MLGSEYQKYGEAVIIASASSNVVLKRYPADRESKVIPVIKRSIKTIEKKMTSLRIHAKNLPIAYYTLAKVYLQLQKNQDAQQYYQALSQTAGNAYYRKTLAKVFQEKKASE